MRPAFPARAAATARLAASCAACLALAASAGAQIYTRKNANGVVEATNVPDGRDYRLAYPGKGHVIHSRAYRLRPSYNGEFNHHIDAAARQFGVDVALVRAVIQVESDFDHLAVSSKGAKGLMQLMPDTAREMGVTNPFDPRQNVFGGVRYLRQMLDTFGNDVVLASAAYNAGPTAVLRYGGVPPFKETRAYVEKVQALLGHSGVRVAARSGPLFLAPSPIGFAPAGPVRSAARRPAPDRRAELTPARPQVYYKWTDDHGVLHVGNEPPAEGVAYTMIRALD